MMNPISRKIVSMLRLKGIARSMELQAAGMTRMEISRRVEEGSLQRLGRGLYALPEYLGTEHGWLAAVSKRSPQVVICLLSALRYHELTTQAPFEVWIAIGNKSHPPRMAYPPLRIVRFSPASLADGIESHTVDGVNVRITSPAKTVADCFKFRNKIGLDVALEALRDARRSRKASMDDLWRFAKINRVDTVMRPYLEALG